MPSRGTANDDAHSRQKHLATSHQAVTIADMVDLLKLDTAIDAR